MARSLPEYTNFVHREEWLKDLGFLDLPLLGEEKYQIKFDENLDSSFFDSILPEGLSQRFG